MQDPDFKFVFSITLDSGLTPGLRADSTEDSYTTNLSGGANTAVTSWSIQVIKQGVTIYDATPTSFGAVDARSATFKNSLISGSRRQEINITLNTFSIDNILPSYNDGENIYPVNQIQLTLLNFIPALPPESPSVFSDMLNNPEDIEQYTIGQIVKAPNDYLYGQASILGAGSPTIGSFVYLVPEPTSFGLIAVSALGMLRRRRY